MKRPTITYTIAMPHPTTHLFAITIDITDADESDVDLLLPSWTPGSYMVRDYARHVQEFAAETGGKALYWHKVAKDMWRIATGGAATLRVTYNVYAFELTVRTSHLDDSHGYMNNANLLMYVAEHQHEPLTLRVVTPSNWKVTTGLELLDHEATNGTTHTTHFAAHDYDELVDCPIECGDHRLLSFEVDGIAHRMALWGHGNEDTQRIVQDTQRIVETQRNLFGSLPYSHYTFILHLADGRGGGLEHRNSVTNLVDRWTFQPHHYYERFLALQSHEFFHVWNVKRIRPAPLGPFNYRGENYTRLLWAMEGITNYYDRLILCRAGLITPERYLDLVSEDILTLQSQPGRNLQSLEESSFDAWIKFYRPDENSANSSTSYYLKGCLVALMLDLEIRQRTNNTRSLDDVLRYLFANYPISEPGIPEAGGMLAAVEAVAGPADGAYALLFARYIAGTEELDYNRALGHAGLRLEWSYKEARSDGPPAWLGVKTKQEAGRTLVAYVPSNSPAYSAGIYAGDELVALNGYRVDEARLTARLSEGAPGDAISLILFRRDELIEVTVTLGPAPYDRLRISYETQSTNQQQELQHAWLGIG